MSYEVPRDERLREAVELSLALVLIGLVLGAFLIFIAFLPMVLSGGHGGNYSLAKSHFPFGMLGTLRLGEYSAILLSLMQFPGDGVVMGVAHYLGWARRAVFFLVILYAAASYICFAVLGRSSWDERPHRLSDSWQAGRSDRPRSSEHQLRAPHRLDQLGRVQPMEIQPNVC